MILLSDVHVILFSFPSVVSFVIAQTEIALLPSLVFLNSRIDTLEDRAAFSEISVSLFRFQSSQCTDEPSFLLFLYNKCTESNAFLNHDCIDRKSLIRRGGNA